MFARLVRAIVQTSANAAKVRPCTLACGRPHGGLAAGLGGPCRRLATVAGPALVRSRRGAQSLWLSSCSRCFRTSAQRQAPLSPLVWMVLRPIGKFFAIVFGRSFRKWWRALPPDKRTIFIESVKRNRWKIIVVTTGLTGFSFHYYYSHLQVTPITERTRFVAFTPDQFVKISRAEFEQQVAEHQGHILSPDHPAYRVVVHTANRLLHGNRDLRQIYDKQWSVTVVEDPDTCNAFVLPSGNIFVFTGMLDFCSNEDQLGCVLGHEMAHAVLGHGAELVSIAHLLDLAVILPLAAIWAFLPNDGISAVTHWFFNRMIELLLTLPYSRDLEQEADEVGLQLAAKACFDVREASAFWGKMAVLDEVKQGGMDLSWLSTHPNHETRQASLDKQLPAMLYRRLECRCPPLPEPDPRLALEDFRKELMKRESLKGTVPVAVYLQTPSTDAKTGG